MSFNKLHVYSHFVHVFMYKWSLIAYKMLLEKGSTAETSWETKGNISRFNLSFKMYNCTAMDWVEYPNICRAHAESTHDTLVV